VPNQYWRSLEAVHRPNGSGRSGHAAEVLRRNAACRRDHGSARRQFPDDSAHANAVQARRRRNRRLDVPGLLFVLPATGCWSIVSQHSLSLGNGLGDCFQAKLFGLTRMFCRRRALLLAAGATWACGVPGTAAAAPLSSEEFESLAARCAPSVAAATLEAVARTESALDPWVLHDNTTNRTEVATSLPAALDWAKRWIGRGDSVDLGLMQIDSANLARLGLSIANAFDACRSIQAGAQILEEDYRAALRDTLSRYNTGDPARGIVNGYVARVEARLPDIAASRLPPPADPPPPAASVNRWDIFASTDGERFVSTDTDSRGH